VRAGVAARHGRCAGLRALVGLLVLLRAGAGWAAPCPEGGASLQVTLQPPAQGQPVTALVYGSPSALSCDDDTGQLAVIYGQRIDCDPAAPSTCGVQVTGLRPGTWTHRILVADGEAAGQFQGRSGLLLDHRAGVHEILWPLFRSVQTVTSLDDTADCLGCLRSALTAAEAGLKPALVQFAPTLSGTIGLSAALPPLAAGQVTLDGIDTDGVALTRSIDANGMNIAALHIIGAQNQVFGLRLLGVGGNSDTLVIESADANDNLLDSLQIIGRSSQLCGAGLIGCIVDGACRVPDARAPNGVCGDDGIAIRLQAGTGGPNRVHACLMSAAHDKGVKVSDGGVAVVEDSIAVANGDGGLQATLGGTLTVRESISASNRGTPSANGLAANGPAVGSTAPSVLTTRGNLCIDNSLRGISVRSLSVADLHDDFVCGNSSGFGVAVMDAAGLSSAVAATGLGVVNNPIGGVAISDNSRASFAPAGAVGNNAFAFNGPPHPPSPTNFRNLTPFEIPAYGNTWQHCGTHGTCNVNDVLALDVFASPPAPVTVDPALPTQTHTRPRITSVEPPFAAAGDLVRIYGSGFDAIDGAGDSCTGVTAANTCRPLHGNCVFVGQSAAQVIAVTPTMLVVRAPFTCVEPVPLRLRTRWTHGFSRFDFCVVPPATATS
jgi:hypothetical protein